MINDWERDQLRAEKKNWTLVRNILLELWLLHNCNTLGLSKYLESEGIYDFPETTLRRNLPKSHIEHRKLKRLLEIAQEDPVLYQHLVVYFCKKTRESGESDHQSSEVY